MTDHSDYIAHIRAGQNRDFATPHHLDEHLFSVAQRAEQFAVRLGTGWLTLAGRWHDLGKFQPNWQHYIRNQTGFEAENAHMEGSGTRVPHAIVGALHAIATLGPNEGHLLAYLIAGHHAGLPDWYGGKAALPYQLTQGEKRYRDALAVPVPVQLLEQIDLHFPDFQLTSASIALWIRLLFSCLVDADWLDTICHRIWHSSAAITPLWYSCSSAIMILWPRCNKKPQDKLRHYRKSESKSSRNHWPQQL
ncbi:MAG: CRISPR-associated endonuclease Cas3'' [Enterobacteriaceae bacterium]